MPRNRSDKSVMAIGGSFCVAMFSGCWQNTL